MVYTLIMAVIKDNETDGVATFTINNGDLVALNDIKEKYNLRDSDNVLTFAIGVLKQAGGRPVTVQNDQGSLTNLLPSDQLQRDETAGNAE